MVHTSCPDTAQRRLIVSLDCSLHPNKPLSEGIPCSQSERTRCEPATSKFSRHPASSAGATLRPVDALECPTTDQRIGCSIDQRPLPCCARLRVCVAGTDPIQRRQFRRLRDRVPCANGRVRPDGCKRRCVRIGEWPHQDNAIREYRDALGGFRRHVQDLLPFIDPLSGSTVCA